MDHTVYYLYIVVTDANRIFWHPFQSILFYRKLHFRVVILSDFDEPWAFLIIPVVAVSMKKCFYRSTVFRDLVYFIIFKTIERCA